MAISRSPTAELLAEGLRREVGRRLQQRRKELGLRYDDPVRIDLDVSGPLRAAVEAGREALARELLADPLALVDAPLDDGPDVARWELDGLTFAARVVRRPA